MKKILLITGMFLLSLVLSGSFSFGLALGNSHTASESASLSSSEPTLQEWFDSHGYAVNVTADETGTEAFQAGYYRMAILAEFADYAPLNNLSWYSVGETQLNGIFIGENVTGNAAYFMASTVFGLCLGSPEGYFYTETDKNSDGKDHALVFVNPNAAGYIIAWEDLYTLGDKDYQDIVLAALSPISVDVLYCPRTLNLKSHGRWITALIKLPYGYDASDVDFSSIKLNATIPVARKLRVASDCSDGRLLIAKFSRAEVIELVSNAFRGQCSVKMPKVVLTVTGCFSDGTPFQGSNKIRVLHCCQ